MIRICAAMALGLVLAQPVDAAHEIANGGFTVTNESAIPAPVADVWQALLDPSRYWNPDHGYSGHAQNFTLEAKAGGCFCEALPDGGSAEHMRVVLVMPGRMLPLSGALGPLQGEGLAGALTWTMQPAENGGTLLTQTYVVGGHMRFAADQIAPAVDAVLSEQLGRLAALFASGTE